MWVVGLGCVAESWLADDHWGGCMAQIGGVGLSIVLLPFEIGHACFLVWRAGQLGSHKQSLGLVYLSFNV